LERYGTPAKVTDIAGHNCIRFVSPYNARVREWVFDEHGAETRHMPEGTLSLTSLDAAVAAARAGSGLAQVPDVLAYRAILEGELRPVLTEHIMRAPSVMLAYPANRYLPAKVRALASFLQKAWPREGWWPKIAAHLQGRPAA
jgi:DNA-binding transcriptional LysR family regulator